MSSHRFLIGVLPFYFVFIYCGSQTRGFQLQSNRVTDWGEWGEMEKCSPGKFVTGMQLKVEVDQGLTKDDTGLNGIKFFCSNLSDTDGHRNTKTANPITSTVGPWGFWRSMIFCSEDFDLEDPLSSEVSYKVAVGFRLRSEGVRNHRDDTAANNLILVCANLNPETGETRTLSRIEGDGTKWGDWTDEQICPSKYAICGLATQIEVSKGRRHDDTALNNLDVECCPVPVLSNTEKTAESRVVTTSSAVEVEFVIKTTTEKSVSTRIEDESSRRNSVREEVHDNEGHEFEITPEGHPQQSINNLSVSTEETEISTEGMKIIEVSTHSLGLDVEISKPEVRNTFEITDVSPTETKIDIYGSGPEISKNNINDDNTYINTAAVNFSLKEGHGERSTTLAPLDLESNYEMDEYGVNGNISDGKIPSTLKPNVNTPLMKNTVGENSELQSERHPNEDYDYGHGISSLGTCTTSKTKNMYLIFVCFMVWKFTGSLFTK